MSRHRKAATVASITGLVLVIAPPALAHIEIDPGTATKGSEAILAFVVPSEEDNADTISIDVKFPDDHPIASVAVRPMAGGWTADVKKEPLTTPVTTDDGTLTEAVTEIVWSGGKIGPGQFEKFEISAGPLPDDVDSITFPIIQTYSDGTTSDWIQETPPGGAEPDHPAPVLQLSAAEGDEHGASSTESSSSSSSESSSAPSVSSTPVVKKETDNGLAIIAIVLASIAVIASIGGVVRAGRNRSSTT